LLEYIVKSIDPKSHIQLCEIISTLYIEILDSHIAPSGAPYYGYFLIRSEPEDYEIFMDFNDLIVEIPKNK
jgi:hypothetical protein